MNRRIRCEDFREELWSYPLPLTDVCDVLVAQSLRRPQSFVVASEATASSLSHRLVFLDRSEESP